MLSNVLIKFDFRRKAVKTHRLSAVNRPAYVGLLLCFGIALSSSACRRGGTPDAAFLQIRDEMRRGQLDGALRDVDAASGKFGARNQEWAARFRIQKAHILMLRGAYTESLQLSNQPLPAQLARTDAEVERKVVQGLAHKFLQQFDSADREINEAEDLGISVHSALLSDVAQSRGMFELDQKNYLKAGAAFRKVLALAREHNEPFREILALGSLGNVAMGDEHYDEAIEWFRHALRRAQSVGALSSQSLALGNMGWNYSVVGDFDNAELSLTEAVKKSTQAGLVGDQTYWLNSLAWVHFQQHRYSEAYSLAQKAYGLAKTQDDKATVTQCLNTLSEIALALGRFADAENSNREATQIENAGLDQFGINYSQLIAGRIEAAKGNYQRAQASYERVLADPKAETPLKWDAHARIAELYAVKQQPLKAAHEFGVALSSVENARDSIQTNEFRLSFLSNAIRFYGAYIDFLIGQHRPLDALKIADLSRSQTLGHGLFSKGSEAISAGPFNPQLTARRLNATLLFYWLGEQSWLWVITPTSTSLRPLPPSQEIDALVKSYRDAFTDPRDPLEAGNPDGKRLYETLVQPAGKSIPKNSRVIVLPDGSLNGLNFETLIVNEPQRHYWIDDVTLWTANSLSLLARSSASTRPQQANLLLVGDALPANPDFPALPQAAREIGVLEKYFAPAQRTEFTQERAVPTAYFRSAPENFSFLHFTAHGTASRTTPLESAVILSPEGDSFKLYARDIVRFPISAYLVTISACNGAGVKTYAGAGLIGLAWAFLRAGAHNVIAGLWEVSAASTPQLMDELYKNLNAGQDPAAALRNAKLTLLHSTGNYRRPFYWAPFVLYVGS